jgi:hypothetical protein
VFGAFLCGIALAGMGSFNESIGWFVAGFAILSSSWAAVAAVRLTGWRDLGVRRTEPFLRALAWTQLTLSGVAALWLPLWILLS